MKKKEKRLVFLIRKEVFSSPCTISFLVHFDFLVWRREFFFVEKTSNVRKDESGLVGRFQV
jgi:hypothetical protein